MMNYNKYRKYSAPNCGRKEGDGYTLHKAPENKEKCMKWESFLGKEIGKKFFLCETHFEKKCYSFTGKFPRLLPNSVPTIHTKENKSEATKMSVTDNADEEMQKDPRITISTDNKLYQGTVYLQDKQSTGLNERSVPSENEFMAISSYKYYDMKHLKRGKAVIFNMEKFPNLEDRTGSAKDVEELQKTFHSLGFEVITYVDNITVDMLKSTLDNIAANAEDNCDCLIVVYMSHGEAGGKLWAKDKRFFVKELWEPFLADKCPALAGKPKLFFIQACRGDRLDSATFVRDAGANDEKTTYPVPYEWDILIANSTIEELQAVRSKRQGSWFIQALCKELNENGRRESIMSILTSVNRRVAMCEFKDDDSEIFKQQPVIVSTLTHELIFENK